MDSSRSSNGLLPLRQDVVDFRGLQMGAVWCEHSRTDPSASVLLQQPPVEPEMPVAHSLKYPSQSVKV